MNFINTTATKERVFKLPKFSFTPKQREANDSKARFKFLRWGRKTGKTTYAERTALKVLGHPDSVYWHIAPTYKQAKLISWEKFKRLIPKEAMLRKPNDTDLTIQLKNGAQLYLMGSDDENSLRGPEPDGMTLEEAAYHKPTVWSKVLRPALMPRQGTALFISTPAGFNWFRDLEMEAREAMLLGDPEWFVSHATCYDNPYLAVDEIEKAKREYKDNPIAWRQEYLADYEASVGRVFSDFRGEVENVSRPTVATRVGRAIDWGMRDDTACLWGYVLNRKLFVYREHAENNLPPSAQAQMIQNKSAKSENIEKNIIGHDAAKMDSEMRGLTVQWHFQNAGIRPLILSSKNKSGSRGMISQLIREKRLIIDKSCQQLVKQLLAYEWKDTILEQTSDNNVDLVDALHYLVELFKFELALNSVNPAVMSYEEKVKQIRLDKAKRNKFAIPQGDNENPYVFGGSAAGYL